MVQATQASVENLLQQRRGTLAFGQGDVVCHAVKGDLEAAARRLSRVQRME